MSGSSDSPPSSSSVPSSSFYSSTSPRVPPPLPERPKPAAGTAHTTYLPPSPPPYNPDDDFPQPVLVSQDVVDDGSSSSWAASRVTDNTAGNDQSWGASDWSYGDTNGNSNGAWGAYSAARKISIDGRYDPTELGWWDPLVRARDPRPGPGVLPPLLERELHPSDRPLYHVVAGTPEHLLVNKPAVATTSTSTATTTAESTTATADAPPPVPSADELRTAVPHPNAYYRPIDNSWIVLIWKSSAVVPPLVPEEEGTPPRSLPSQSRRTRYASCLDSGPTLSREISHEEFMYGNASAQRHQQPRANETHHFHFYPRAVDPAQVAPPVQLPQGERLDLWMCCQCQLYVLVSAPIHGVIRANMIAEVNKQKRTDPIAGKSGEECVMIAWETVLTIIENRLWRNEIRKLPVTNSAFMRKLGWSSILKELFEILQFPLVKENDTQALSPPAIDTTTPEGKQNRQRLIRAWVELNSWLVDFKKQYPKITERTYRTTVNAQSASEDMQTAIGAHPTQISRGFVTEHILYSPAVHPHINTLGLTPETAAWDKLAFAYLAQCRCDPAGTITYHTAFTAVFEHLTRCGELAPEDVQSLLLEEQSRGRFTHAALSAALDRLGFGEENVLRVGYEADETEEEFVRAAYESARKLTHSSHERRELAEALRIVAHMRGSRALAVLVDGSQNQVADAAVAETRFRNVREAYAALGVGSDVDEGTLLAVFSMQVAENPGEEARMRAALEAIAERAGSARLTKFLEIGIDPGEILAPTRADLPRGLNQLGNTCYLNSLLQYFYTIRDLREAVVALGQAESKVDEKLTEANLQKHRVGGRLVTRREVYRSKKFVSLLANLFWEMEYTEHPAITPALELAKLALVTSKDEEEDAALAADQHTDSSNDTDATLVEDRAVSAGAGAGAAATTTATGPASPGSPGSVLGKRGRVQGREEETEYVIVSKPPSPVAESSMAAIVPPVASGSRTIVSPAEDVLMRDVTDVAVVEEEEEKRPVPKRKVTQTGESTMMFGRQHDVAECMDNCVFQIETALLKFDELTGSEDGKTSVVKRLFYGKLKQRITALPTDLRRRSRASIHEKEDLFSHLPLNVSDESYDLYDGLSGYFDDVVEFEGKQARMQVSLVDLPPLLQIQLQRVQFDRDTLSAYKSQAFVKFDETIYVDRFLESADPIKRQASDEIQAKLRQARERIIELTRGKNAPYGAALANTARFFTQMGTEDDGELALTLQDEDPVLTQEIATHREQVEALKRELEDLWRGHQTVAYDLTSVFIHRGSSPSWGHYFFYSRNLPDHPDVWFKYNDSEVTEVSKEEVFADTTGSTANPYLLVYARKGSQTIDTVKRFDPANLEEDTV